MILLAELMTLFYLPLWFVFTTNLGKWVLIYCYSCDVTVGCDDALNRAHGLILSSPRGWIYNKAWGNELDYIVIFCDVARGRDDTLNRAHGLILLFSLLECCFSAIFRGQGSFR